MQRFIASRMFQALVVLVGVSIIAYGLMFLAGDPTLLLLPPDATREQVERFRSAMGFDQPFFVQYGRFLGRVLHGDFGQSTSYNSPALDLVVDRLGPTMLLGSSAMLLATVVGVPIGIAAAIRPFSWLSRVAMMLGMLAYSVPVFWSGVLLILVFAVGLAWLPPSGYGGWRHLLLPAVALSLQIMPLLMRLVWSGMIEVLGEDYVRTARAKGLSGYHVVMKHAARNAALPVITIMALETANLLGGAVLTETVFSWPGVGRLMVNAIFERDYAVVQTVLLLMAALFTAANLAADIVYAWLDPRVRLD